MTKDILLNWYNNNRINFEAFAINREPYYLSMAIAMDAWINSDFSEDYFQTAENETTSFCIWHNYAPPGGQLA